MGIIALFILLILIAPIVTVIIQLMQVARLKRDVAALSDAVRRLSLNYQSLKNNLEAAVARPLSEETVSVKVDATASQPSAEEVVEILTSAPEASLPEPELVEAVPPPLNPSPQARPRYSRAWGGKGQSSGHAAAASSGAARGERVPETLAVPYDTELSRESFERRLTTHWFVWIGGTAIAIGGLFFVKYAHENHLLSPAMIISLTIVIGLGLMAWGDQVLKRERRLGEALDYVPASLSAAGLVITFGSFYAAYAVYDLISVGAAFFWMAVVAIWGLVLSLRQGPLMAALGFLGSYCTPLFLYKADLSAGVLFSYLAIIVIACFIIVRWRGWWWLAGLALVGALGWALVWVKPNLSASDGLVLEISALCLGLVPLLLLGRKRFEVEGEGTVTPELKFSLPIWLFPLALAVMGVIQLVLVKNLDYSGASLVFLGIGMGLVVAYGWSQDYGYGLLIPAALVLGLLFEWPGRSFVVEAMDEAGHWSNVPARGASAFLIWMGLFGVGFTGVGILGYARQHKFDGWAALAAAVGALYLMVSWFKLSLYRDDGVWLWSLGAVGLSLIFLLTLFMRTVKKSRKRFDRAQIFLLSASAILSGFACWLNWQGLWFILSLSVLTLAYAVVTAMLKRPALGLVPALLGTATSALLYLTRDSWTGAYAEVAGQQWPLLAYGVPAVLFSVASLSLKRCKAERGMITLQALSLTLFMTLTILEIRILIAGSVTAAHYGLLEVACDICVWLVVALGLLWQQQRLPGLVKFWGARILLGMSCIGLIAGPLLLLNPLVNGEPVMGTALLNSLLLAYLIPALLLSQIAPRLRYIGWSALRPALGVLIMALLFSYLTLEIKRLFQGSYLSWEIVSNAENYSYSAAWLALGVVLYVSGLKLKQSHLRYAGLSLVVLVIFKVFLWDMSGLSGIYRILSLMGLGFCLVGIGWLYGQTFDKWQKLKDEVEPAPKGSEDDHQIHRTQRPAL